MKHRRRRYLLAELCLGSWVRAGLLAVGLLLGLGPTVLAQTIPPIVIPIVKERVKYYRLSEDGSRITCGIQLFGSFPVYRGRTNLSDYRIFIPGVQNPGPWRLDADGRFRFYAYFNGSDGPASSNPECNHTIGEGMPDWHAEYQPKRPSASFTSTAVASVPGEWDFLSTSTDAEDQPLIEQWVFGDGTDGSGKKVGHRYTKPGSFSVALTVMDTDGLTNRTTRTISVAAPKALVSLRLFNKHPLNQIEIDEEFEARLDVKASEDGVGPLSELVFTSTNALRIPPQFQILVGSSETNVGTLQPGQVQSFTWKLKATNAGEFALVAAGVRGKDLAGRTVTGVGETELGEVTSLIVGITQIPPILKLGADNNGDGKTNELDKILQMVVGITNVSKQDVVGVETTELNDPIKFTSLAETINVWVVPDEVPPGFFGTIKPGAANAVLRTNTYLASDKTFAEARIVLHGKTGDATVGAAGTGILNVGGDKLLEARFDIEERPYQSGQTVRLFGTLKNVSRYKDRQGGVLDEGKTVGVVIYPTVQGNGALGYVTLQSSGARTPDGPTAFLLEPDQTLDIAAIIPTAEVPTDSRVSVVYKLDGYVHGEGPKPRRARPGEFEIIEKPSDGWSASHSVTLAGVPLVTDPWLVCPTDLATGEYLSCRFTVGFGNAAGGMVDLAVMVGSGIKEIGVGVPRLAAWHAWAVEQALKGLTDPAARDRLAKELIQDYEALKQVGVESVSTVVLSASNIGPAIEKSIIETGRLLETGDLKLIAGAAAEIVGENIDMPLEALVAARTARKAALISHGAESAAKEALQEQFERQARELAGEVDDLAARGSLRDLSKSDTLPTGVNVTDNPRVYRDAFNLRKSVADGLRGFAKRQAINIFWDAVSERAFKFLDAGTHLLRKGGVSVNTVSDIDRRFLGVPDRFADECVLAEPPIPWISPDNPAFDDVANNFLNRFPELKAGTEASQLMRAQVYERLKLQMNEWPKEVEKFIEHSKKGIVVDPATAHGGVAGALLGKPGATRAARIETYSFDDPYTGKSRNAYRLLMDDGAGNFKPLTGQANVSVFLNPDGTMPSLPTRLRVIRNLAKVGMVWTDLFADTMEGVRKSIVENVQSKRMLAATSDGRIVTTQYRDNLSIIEGGRNAELKAGKSETAFMEGAISEVNSLEREAPDTLSGYVKEQVQELFTPESLLEMVAELKAESDRQSGKPVRIGEDGLPEVYESEPTNAPVSLLSSVRRYSGARPAADGPVDMLTAELQKLSAAGWVKVRKSSPTGAAGGRWRPATVEEVRGGPPGSGLRYAPYTYLSADILAGTGILPVLSADEVGVAPRQPFFAVGDRIVIDPGGSREEFAVIAGIQPFTLSRPLQFAQEAGSMVLFLSGINDFKRLPGALPAQENLLVWLRADAGLSVTNGTNVISWTDQSRNGFVFSAPTEATRPAWVTNSAPGVPAVRFNSGSTPRLQGNLGRTLTNATIFTVARYLNNSTGSRYIYSFGTINFSGLMMTLARNDGDNALHYDGAAGRVAANAIPGTGFHVFSQVYGGDRPDSHQLAVDGRMVIESRTTVGRAYSAVATNVVLGKYVTATFGFTGDLAEWIVYDRALSTAERLEVEEYLRQRAQLALVAPPGSLDVSASEILDYDVTATPAVSWSLDLGNRQLKQAGYGDPSLALSGSMESGQVLRTKLRGSAGSGALGVVFGYQHRGQFHLFDWRQTASNVEGWGIAPAGMRLRTFQLPVGAEPTGADFWSGLDTNRVTTWRTNAVPWVADREYEVVLRLGEDATVVEVNFGVSNLETWTVPELKGISGRFGHYANSMPEARFGPVLLPGEAPLITGIEPGDDGNWTVRWLNGVSPFVVESTTDLSGGVWYPVAPATLSYSRTIQAVGETQLFRIRSVGVVPDSSGAGGSEPSQTFGNNGRLWLIRGTGPTRIEAENFDEGGEGVAYHDTTAQNSGGVYRTEGVDIGPIGDFGGGHAVGSIAAGEWLEYTIRVETAGVYRLRARTARGQSGSRMLRFLFNGVDKTGNLVIPATGNWASYATVESDAFELTAGTHILHADVTGGGFDLNWIEIAPDQPVVQSTFGNNGNPWSIDSTLTTRIEAENFDQGGQDVAYHETSPQNAGGAYRAEAVDIYATSDSVGGHTVGATAVGEWLEYTIQVQLAGAYRLRARAARGQSGTRTVRFLADGVDKTGNLVIPATGNWETYATVESGRFELPAGTQVLRAEMTSSDFNLNWIEIVPVVPVAQSTFGNSGNPWSIGTTTVTRIEAENFDQGGPDVAYQDTDSRNQGSAYRSEDVDIQPTTDTGGGFNVSWIEAGEWLEYTMDVAVAGTYQLRFRTARAPAGSSTLRVLVDGVDKTGNVTIPRTVGAQTWTTVTKTGVSLDAGVQTLRIQMVVGGFNLNWIEIAP